MKLLSKLSILAVIAGLAGGGWHQAHVSRSHESELASLGKRISGQRLQILRLSAERDEFLARAAETPLAPAPSFATGDAGFDAQMEPIVPRLKQLRKWLKENPSYQIPEFQFLKDTDWFEVASGELSLDPHIAALSLLRAAKRNLGPLIRGALKSYAEVNDGQVPADLSQLTPYFVFPVSDAIVQRYEMRVTGLAANVPDDMPLIAQKASATIDPLESSTIFCRNPYLFQEFLPFFRKAGLSPDLMDAISKANQAYRLANHTGDATTDAQLLPYFSNPEDAAKFAQNQAPDNPAKPKNVSQAESELFDAYNNARNAYRADHNGIFPEDWKYEDVLPYFRNPRDREAWKAYWGKPPTDSK